MIDPKGLVPGIWEMSRRMTRSGEADVRVTIEQARAIAESVCHLDSYDHRLALIRAGIIGVTKS